MITIYIKGTLQIIWELQGVYVKNFSRDLLPNLFRLRTFRTYKNDKLSHVHWETHGRTISLREIFRAEEMCDIIL